MGFIEANGIDPKQVVLGKTLHLPAYGEDSVISSVFFVTGKRGSGKSWTSAVMMEEFNRLGLQFVCFDALDAHGNLPDLEGVEGLQPAIGQSVDMKALVKRLGETNKSLVIKLAGLPLQMQQELIADYCEALLEAHLGKGIHTVIEECQDFIPQMGRPVSFDPIVRLCKLGRALGYGATLVSQRPAGVNKEALSQASIYLVHNVINNRDLKALDEQLSFGTDKKVVRRLLNGIAAARKGECVAYAPEYFRDRGYIVVDKIRGDRRVEHKGNNIDVQAAGGLYSGEYNESIPSSVAEISSVAALESMAAPESHLPPFAAEPQRISARERLRESFYPNLDSQTESDLLKSPSDYSWSAESRSPAVEYDATAPKEKTSTRRTPLFAIVGTVAASAFGWTLLRNLK
jgi:hypothetical protein